MKKQPVHVKLLAVVVWASLVAIFVSLAVKAVKWAIS